MCCFVEMFMGYSINDMGLHDHCFIHGTYVWFYHGYCHRFSSMAFNHTIQPPHHISKFIYLRSTVALYYWVYKYTSVDINTPYRRFKCIVVGIFVIIYIVYATVFYICIITYICLRYFTYLYIHMYLTPIFICIYVHILIHIFVFSRHYILTAHVFATTSETACNGRTDVRFNTFKIFNLIEHFR